MTTPIVDHIERLARAFIDSGAFDTFNVAADEAAAALRAALDEESQP